MPETRTRFLELLEPHHDRLYRYALAVMGDAEDARDLVSDTILAVYEQFDRVRDPAKFFHLLLTIASRKAKRRIFRRRRFVPLEESLVQTLESSHLTIEHATEISIVLDLLQQLPKKMRETFVLYEVADLSLLEIQRLQGGSLSGVKSRLSRARLKLDHLLRQDEASARGSSRSEADWYRTSATLAFTERYGG